MAPIDPSVYLAKTVSIPVATLPWSKQIHISEEFANLEWTDSQNLLEAIRAYIRQLKLKGERFLDFTLNTHSDGEPYFDVSLYKVDLEHICKILPEPSLEIEINMIPGSAQPGISKLKFERRFLLTDLLTELTSKGVNQILKRLVSSGVPYTRSPISVTYDIILGWTDPSPDKIKMDGNAFARNLFGKEASKDLVIVVGNGAEIKCHRLVLEAHSDALSAMLSPVNGMKESNSGRVNMPTHSEEAVSNFVRYLYGFELDPKELSCVVAVQLFKLADMYELAQLQESLVSMLLLKRGKGWYTPDELLELHFHVKNLDNFKHLCEYTLGVLVSLNQEIRVCDRFLEMEQTDPKSATGLVWQLFDKK